MPIARSKKIKGTLITRADIVRVTGKDPKTVGRWIRDGKIRARGPEGAQRLFHIDDVEAVFGPLTSKDAANTDASTEEPEAGET